MRSSLIHQIVVIGQVKFRLHVKGLPDSVVFAKIILSLVVRNFGLVFFSFFSLNDKIIPSGRLQDQRRLGALIVPNKDELLLAAKKSSIIDADASELSKENMMNLLRGELRMW